jgi:NAD(P)H-hydrate repair Nnr-like enzyme with NAD(P)H-hydrate dehydratase domain
MADKLIAALFCLPNTTYDLPAFWSADPSSKLNAGKSYIVFGKQNNTDAINLSAIAAGTSTGGFVINGESASDYSGWSVSSAGDV